ncbi:hypothetical protein ACXR2W_11945 [Leucobacter sp. HY1908]
MTGFVAITGPIAAAILSGGLASALVTFLQNRWLENRRAQDAEKARLRQSFAEAFEAYADYKEFPYLVRRRRADQPSEERARLTRELNAVQSRLSYFRAWMNLESPAVGLAYSALLNEMRNVAGTAIKAAWNDEPADSDAGVVIPRKVIDLNSLVSFEDEYMQAAAERLRKLTPWKARRR